MKKLLLCILLLPGWLVPTNAQNKGLVKLEKRIDSLTKALKQQTLKYEQTFKAPLTNAQKAYENKLDEKLLNIKSQNTRIEWLGWVIGSSTIVALLVLGLQYFRNIRKLVEQKLDERINLMIAQNDERLQKVVIQAIENHSLKVFEMISANDQNAKAIKEARILILSEQREHDLFFKKFFQKKRMQFTAPHFKQFDEVSPHGNLLNQYDLVILNNDAGNKLDKSIDAERHGRFAQYVSDNQQTLFFYFGAGRLDVPKARNLNFANSKFTCYQNITAMILNKELV